jgi:hypothetical protein
MGTSKQFPTPSGGPWTPLKNDITDYLNGDKNITPGQIVSGTINALGGLGVPSPGRATPGSGGSSGGGRGGGGGGGGGSRGGGGSSGRRSVGKAASGLGGFGAAVQDGGLEAGLKALGLDELSGRPAVEVIDKIADHLAEGADPTQYDLLNDALKTTLLEAAALGEQTGFEDLDSALQGFLEKNGVEGLVKSYLSNYVYGRVWVAVENHVEIKDGGRNVAQAMSIAVGNACRSHVESLIQETKDAGRFNNIDWFGREGTRLGNELVGELEGRLRA